jgi:hypothetical protein
MKPMRIIGMERTSAIKTGSSGNIISLDQSLKKLVKPNAITFRSRRSVVLSDRVMPGILA